MFNTIKNLLFPPSNNSGTQDTTQDFVNIESIHENMIINKSNDLNYKQLYCDDNFVIYERLNSNFGGE